MLVSAKEEDAPSTSQGKQIFVKLSFYMFFKFIPYLHLTSLPQKYFYNLVS